jgi:hypothetical protein
MCPERLPVRRMNSPRLPRVTHDFTQSALSTRSASVTASARIVRSARPLGSRREYVRGCVLIAATIVALSADWPSLDAQDRRDTHYEELVTLYRTSPDEAVSRALQLTQAAREAGIGEAGIRLAPDAELAGRSSFLRELVERRGGDLLISDSKGLPSTFERIVGEFRRRYLVSYMPSGRESGWHTIEVTLKNRRGKVTARRGYQR